MLKHFNGTAILTSFVLPASGAFPASFTLNFNDALLPGELTMLYLKLVHRYGIAINFLMFLNNYHYIRLNYTSASQLINQSKPCH